MSVTHSAVSGTAGGDVDTHDRPINVAGAGIIGLATAFELVQRGKKVRIFDPAPGLRGDSASFFAGGMLAPMAEVQFQQDDLFPLMGKSAELYPDFLRRISQCTSLPTGYDRTGTLIVAADRADAQHLGDISGYYQSAQRPTHRLTLRQARALEPGLAPALAGCVHIPSDHQVHPRLLLRALMDALRAQGAQFIHSRIEDYRLPSGEQVRGDVVCTGLGDAHRFPLRPVLGDIIRLKAPRSIVRHVVRGFVQDRPVYIIPRPDGEIAIGATSREDKRRLPSVDGVYQLLRDAIAIVPGLEEAEIMEISVGARPGTPDDLPIFGWVDGQLVSNGYFRHGILLAALAGYAGAEALCTGEIVPEFSPCDPGRFGTS
ncbi:glycine oxidase ThiO [Corynebacterium felinum]|uniref:glycine oxidase n=1 Tax=Corynebacterium felinum TaxID=131318 RepID=A0ABU2BF65_9CORY|nr:glycine oxidase ThiO [Corynebacterium felinum]MDF5819843.1 glycine oxidase ThiO [Corynebacterium felinum]MDR7356014.1 glycine oxidase [Corynebacterium felinum]WJY95349.1 Hydrogen cyanide synthase subunit HcnC precursor [Corynebacterium felinum]